MRREEVSVARHLVFKLPAVSLREGSTEDGQITVRFKLFPVTSFLSFLTSMHWWIYNGYFRSMRYLKPLPDLMS